MLHIATTHISPRWIEIQARQLREHVSVPYETWASLHSLDPSHGSSFDHLVAQKGPLASKLNHLAVEISQLAASDDLLMFLDGDAFPIADPMPLIADALATTPLLAVRRPENAGDPQPCACFCVTTVGTWRALAGDWSDGYPWSSERGERVTDVGANLLRRLELTGTAWKPLERSNSTRLDPLFFAVYGHTIYHHGVGELTRAHRAHAPRALPVPRAGALAVPVERVNRERLLLWERRTLRRARARSEALYEKIRDMRSDWLDDVR